MRTLEQPEILRVRLPGRPASVAEARRLLRSRADEAPAGVDLDTAELLLSEVMTNAVVHAGTAVELLVSRVPGATLAIEVWDGNPHGPVRKHYLDTATIGRGLRLLDELATHWGVREQAAGKVVWFHVAGDGQPPAPSRLNDTSVPSAAAGRLTRVGLRNVPLRLHAAWQEQAAAVLRDYLLATMESEEPESAIEQHAACSRCLALLAEHIPAPATPPAEDAASAKATAHAGDEDDEWADTVTLPLTPREIAGFAVLDETLDRAIGLGDAGALLPPPTSTAGRRLRRWICDQVASQAAGAAPTPWSTPVP